MTKDSVHLLFLFLGIVAFIIYPASAMFIAGLWIGVTISFDPMKSENNNVQ